VIPGNERPVIGLINDLIRLGVDLHSPVTDPDVHTSGHAGRSEQTRMIDLIRPRAFLPVHGTMHHLVRHAELARTVGVEKVLVAENGNVLRYSRESGIARDGRFKSGSVSVSSSGEPLPDEVLRKRGDLGRSGIAIVTIVLDHRDQAVTPPTVTSRGVPSVDENDAALRSVAREIAATLERVRNWRDVDLPEEIRRAARRRIGEISGTRPIVEVQLVRWDPNR
jgi:ribonuclease J